jgi:hypothetical protein
MNNYITEDSFVLIGVVESLDGSVTLVASQSLIAFIPSILNIKLKCMFSYPTPLIKVSQSSGRYLKISGGLLKSLV